MKIIDSIKINFFALAAYSVVAHAGVESTLIADGDRVLSSVCYAEHKCSTIKRVKGVELARINFPYAPVSAREVGDVMEVSYSCGTECSATFFILSNNSISGPYSLVDSVDFEKGTLLSVGQRELRIFRFSPAVVDAIKIVDVEIPEDSTLPSRLISSGVLNHVYFVVFKGMWDRERHIEIDQ